MDYSKQTCSRELAEEMERLGICQDGAELFWCLSNGNWSVNEWGLLPFRDKTIVAPTIIRMMEELPDLCNVRLNSGIWQVCPDEGGNYIDNHLPNALAKALISIKKGQSNGG